MSFNSAAVANQLVTILSGLPGMGAVQIGAPVNVGPQVSAYVTLGGQTVTRKTTGTTRRRSRFFCLLVYRLDGAETTAETTLMNLADAFMDALHSDATLGGTVLDLEATSAAADEPDYQVRGGKEYREYPIIVTVTQAGTYSVNP